MLNHGINAINKNCEILPGNFNSVKAAPAVTVRGGSLNLSNVSCFLQPLLFLTDCRGS